MRKRILMLLFCVLFSISVMMAPCVAVGGQTRSETDPFGWWYTDTPTYYVDEYLVGTELTSLFSSFTEAISSWNGALSLIEMQYEHDYRSADIYMGASRLSTINSPGISYKTLYVFYDSVITSASVYMNTANSSLMNSLGTHFAESVAAHEIGHLYGLAHVDDTSSIMSVYRNRTSVYAPTTTDTDNVSDYYTYVDWEFLDDPSLYG